MNYMIGAVLAAIALGFILYIGQSSESCEAKGGTLVRGVFGYECVTR